MIFEGLKLTILGMSVVFIFLVILVFIIKLNAKLCSSATRNEINALNANTGNSHSAGDGTLVSVITAAIKKYKNK